MKEEEKIPHAILSDDMDGNLVGNDYKTYTCKKCKREYIMILEDDICPTCLNKPFLKKILDKIKSGR